MPTRSQPPPPRSEPQIGFNMRELRKAAGLSQGELAERMRDEGRSSWWQNTVSRIELGRQAVVTLADIMALQKILGTEVVEGTELSAAMKDVAREAFVAKARTEITNISEQIMELSDANERLSKIIDALAGQD